MKLDKITIHRPDLYSGFNGDSYMAAMQADQQVLNVLKKIVIGPFERGLKKRTGYGDDNVPTEETVTKIPIGGLKFKVSSKPGVKNPAYVEMYENFNNFLDILLEQYQEGVSRKDVVTLDGEPYVNIDVVVAKYEAERDDVVKQGVSHSIILPEDEFGDLEKIVVPLKNYEELFPESGRIYLKSKAFSKKVKADPYEKFFKELKAQSPYGNANVPKQTEIVLDQMDNNWGYMIQVIPRNRINYKPIFDALFGSLSKTKKIAKATGLFTVIQGELDIPALEKLDTRYKDGKRVKRLGSLDLREHDDRKFVSLNSLIKLVGDLTKQHTNREIDKQIPVVFPLPDIA